MLIIDMPHDFVVGSTHKVRINGEDRRLHRTDDTLVILPVDADEPRDERAIIIIAPTGGQAGSLTTFYAADSHDEMEEAELTALFAGTD